MTEQELEKQEKKIQRAKQESDMEWIVAGVVALVLLAVLSI